MAELIYNEETDTWALRQMLRSPYIDYFDGRFFVTFQVYHNKSVFGAIVGEECKLNELGEAVRAAWEKEPEHVAGLTLGEFVVMPNHFHAIVEYRIPTGRSGPVATAPLRAVGEKSAAVPAARSGAAATSGDRATAPGRLPMTLYCSKRAQPAARGGAAATSGDRATAPGRFGSSKYARDPRSRDLPYVIGLFKSYTTNLYLKLKAAGRCVDIGPKLWQDSFYDELIRNEEQYRNTAHYILTNAQNWNSDRFGAITSYAEGNIGLLQSEYVAYMSSEGVEAAVPAARSGAAATAPGRLPMTLYCSKRAQPAARGGAAATSGAAATKPPIISTFTSYYERQVLAKCLASGRRFIWVCPGGIGEEALAKTAAARADGRALLISPVATAPQRAVGWAATAPTARGGAVATGRGGAVATGRGGPVATGGHRPTAGGGVTKQRANYCNEFIAKNAAEIWVGHIRPGGSLETILRA